MKASIYKLLLCLLISSTAIAQNTATKDTLAKKLPQHKVLIVIDTITTLGNDELIFNPSKIASVSIIKPDSSTLLYGEKGKYGAVIIKLRQATRFITLEEILNKFNIRKEDRSFRVCINRSIVAQPTNILADDEEVLRVEITTERNWRYYDSNIDKEKFINIVTREGQRNGL